MDDEVGIAADRRGEMRVAAQVEAEMAVVLGAYSAWACERSTTSLTSGSCSVALHPGEDAVEMRRPQRLALGELDADRAQELAESVELLDRSARRGRGRSAADGAASSVSAAATLARIMNSSISRCASSRSGQRTPSPCRPASSTSLRSGRSRSSGSRSSRSRLHGRVGGPERPQHALEQRRRRLVGRAVDGRLRLRVAELGGRAHHDAVEAVAASCGRRRR